MSEASERSPKRVIYCPTCANEIPVEEYTGLKICRCKECGTVFELIEKPRTKWIIENRWE